MIDQRRRASLRQCLLVLFLVCFNAALGEVVDMKPRAVAGVPKDLSKLEHIVPGNAQPRRGCELIVRTPGNTKWERCCSGADKVDNCDEIMQDSRLFAHCTFNVPAPKKMRGQNWSWARCCTRKKGKDCRVLKVLEDISVW
ncbi:BZ3500_MvSof-1268-A1-R1_Chr3-1g05712 [Microbotryum saponariae]|uniref:BZ3500_MvSof-1268-A1-R1_Chr3-1g05712 protein n=1 Tax=Microbotryum saponariae TaxID=289078 RepID=A0A2X0NBI9_9BASI|nr:BZ3500_MvSof-1268-A1-R1_Chr3-1g05712 [Microbotryum saponariae]SDA04902.1 BZ3501_MvSof-1269-A2-R1_Chr3-1g05382 [Microbotryum saponariae]